MKIISLISTPSVSGLESKASDSRRPPKSICGASSPSFGDPRQPPLSSVNPSSATGGRAARGAAPVRGTQSCDAQGAAPVRVASRAGVRPPHRTGCAATRLHRAARGGTPLRCARAGAKGCVEQAVAAENKRRGLTTPSKCSHDVVVASQGKAWRWPALSCSGLRRPLLAARGGTGGCAWLHRTGALWPDYTALHGVVRPSMTHRLAPRMR
ncbi:hypothetical protein C2845_PM02G17860 [Panicum miliaceum]|uniref:Uncharacterized protein n=1 Tax=Panicum miliaceum TaxID=4540 RepID=A0A3L6S7T1_PANMI|nr:hypothetical protein C2845_PM02G17860 [Panicum miliaceum]